MIRTWTMISNFRKFSKTSFFLLALIAVTLAGFGCKKKRDIYKYPYMAPFKNISDGYALFFLSSIEGYVEPCGCTSNPLGGLARFATVFSDIKFAIKKVDLIDAGNLLFDSTKRNDADKCQDEARINLLLKTLASFGLKYTFSGSFDDARGATFRNDVLNAHGIARLSSVANFKPEQSIGDFIKIIDNEERVGVMAISEPFSTVANVRAHIGSMAKAYKKDKKLKALIAISQMPEAMTKEVFLDLPGIDVVIGGQVSSMAPKTPLKLGTGPIYVEGGRQGQNVTLLLFENLSQRGEQELALDNRAFEKSAREDLLRTRIAALKDQLKNADKARLSFLKERLNLAMGELKKIEQEVLPMLSEPSVSFHAIPLTKKIESDALIKAQVEGYEKSIPDLVKKCEENIECPKAMPGEATFVGVETCKNCHQEAYKVWEKAVFQSTGLDESGKEFSRTVGHSKAWKTLTDVHKDLDRNCIGCHSIGFMQKGGYCKATAVGSFKNVQCESCHGAGSLHAASGDKRLIKRNVPEETCRGCHHVPHIESYESFNYREEVMKILGVGHGEKLLKELKHSS